MTPYIRGQLTIFAICIGLSLGVGLLFEVCK